MENDDDGATTEPVVTTLEVEGFEKDVTDWFDEGFELVCAVGVGGIGFESKKLGAGFVILNGVFGSNREGCTSAGRLHGVELGGSCCNEVLASQGELVEDGDVAEKLVHTVSYGVVDSGDDVAAFTVAGGVSGGDDGGLGEEGAEVSAAADSGELEEFAKVFFEGYATFVKEITLELHD